MFRCEIIQDTPMAQWQRLGTFPAEVFGPSADNKGRLLSRKSPPRTREIAILRVLTATMTFHSLTSRIIEQVEVSVPSNNVKRLSSVEYHISKIMKAFVLESFYLKQRISIA